MFKKKTLTKQWKGQCQEGPRWITRGMSIGQREIDNDNVHSDCDDHDYHYKEKENLDNYDDDEEDNMHNTSL